MDEEEPLTMEPEKALMGESQMMGNPIRISIIIPVYNNFHDLYKCLLPFKSSPYPEPEVIVVDDASTDESGSVAIQMGTRVLRLNKNSGPAAARNFGACEARGDILFFVDSDVVVTPETTAQVAAVFEKNQDIAAVFGSYDTFPQDKGLFSQYRNLLHHFVHQNGNPEASTFWAGCGAIRRSVFETIGGFDEKRFPRSSIEDIELGYRLCQAGHRILLDKTLTGTHLKRWTLWSIIRTDILCRAVPWARLILENKNHPNDLNLKGDQRLSGVLVTLALFFLVLGIFRTELLFLAAVFLLWVILLNRALYTFFSRKRGLRFSLACIPLHLFYFIYSTFSYLYVFIGFQLNGSALKQNRSA